MCQNQETNRKEGKQPTLRQNVEDCGVSIRCLCVSVCICMVFPKTKKCPCGKCPWIVPRSPIFRIYSSKSRLIDL